MSKVGGLDSTANLAASQSATLTHYKVDHILVNSPMTILDRSNLFSSQSEAPVNFGGPWNMLDGKIQILSDFIFSDFWSNFQFSYFFPKSLSKINLKG